jgi:TRAP-type C4-dicarboxylate transport system substrate-binding protein
MMKLVRRFLTLCATLLVSSAFAAGNAWSPQADDHPTNVALRAFMEQMRSITGKAPAAILPSSAQRDQTVLLDTIRKGEISAAVLPGSAVGRIAPMANVMRLPYIVGNARQMFSMLDGDVGQQMEKRFSDQGIVVLGWFDGGTRTIYSRKKLDSVGSLSNVKIRIPARKDLSDLISSLGGSPQQIDYKEVNSAFDAGLIDAAENDLLAYESEGHYKRAPFYYMNNNHIVQFEALVVPKKWLDSLPPAQRDAVRKAGREVAQLNRDTWNQRMTKARARLEKEGVKFVEYGNSGVLLSRAATLYRPYMNNPETRDLLVTLMTNRI